MAISDFKRVPKSDPKYNQRWYENPKTGERISKWEFQKRSAGGIDPRERAQIRLVQKVNPAQAAKRKRRSAIIKKFKQQKAKELGVKPRDIKVRGQTDTALEFKELDRGISSLSKADLADKSATGKLAQMLVRLGLRQPEWDMPVGESPK